MKKINTFIISILICFMICVLEFKERDVSVFTNITDEKDFRINNKLVALTFDDGPTSKTKEIIDLLNKYDIKATFFLLGENVVKFPGEVMYIINNKHEIGNHSYTHADFKLLSKPKIEEEINKTQNVIFEITNQYPQFFRFPYGSYNKSSLAYISLPIILWNVDSLDWKYLDRNIIIRNATQNLNDESIILFHDSFNYKKEAIEFTIKILIDQDYKFVTVSELLVNKELINGKIYF